MRNRRPEDRIGILRDCFLLLHRLIGDLALIELIRHLDQDFGFVDEVVPNDPLDLLGVGRGWAKRSVAKNEIARTRRCRRSAAELNDICLQITRIEGNADDNYDLGLELLDRWLGPANSADELKSLLRPYNADLMKAYAVSRVVNSVKNDTEECIEPIEDDGV